MIGIFKEFLQEHAKNEATAYKNVITVLRKRLIAVINGGTITEIFWVYVKQYIYIIKNFYGKMTQQTHPGKS